MRALMVVVLFTAACGDDGGAGASDGSVTSDGSGSGSGSGTVDGNTLPASASAGCGMATSNATGMWVKRTIQTNRDLWVWLPADYDASKPYPIIYELHGCSSSPQRENNNVPVEREIGADAIAVRGRAAADCWDTNAAGSDVAYFDAMLEDVEGAFCVDTARRFLTGYSSGSFMSHRLACIRGDKLRGVATIAGGQSGNNCTGNVGALLIHDANDATVNISASVSARDNHIMRNGCTTQTTPTDHDPCITYSGCTDGKPVVWCPTSGQNHARQDNLAAPIFWWFVQSLL